MLKYLIVSSSLLLLAMQPGTQAPTPAMSDAASDAPSYAKDGNLMAPAGYREWVFLTSGIDMTYTAPKAGDGAPSHSMFDNVFVNPSAYRGFLTKGTWPDGTVMVLEIRGAENPVSINKRGHTQSGEVMGMEIHVKDKGGWAFYDLSGGGPEAKLIPKPASCYTCHEEHAAADTTFVQFYPTLMPVAKEKKTLNPAYLKEIAAPAAEGAAK